MHSRKFIQTCFATVALIAIAGCASNTSKVTAKSSHVKSFNGSYKANSSVSVQNDIKGILVAGGLSTGNPSAATRNTRLAETKQSATQNAAVTQLVAKLEGSSPSSIGSGSPSRIGTSSPRVSPAEASPAPTTLMASLQQNRNNSKAADAKTRRAPKPQVQPKAPESDPVMLALNSVEAPKPASAPRNQINDEFDAAPKTRVIEAPEPQIASVRYPDIGVTESSGLRYPDVAVAVAYAAPEPAAAPRKKQKTRTASVSQKPRAIPKNVVEAPEASVQQASVEFSKPRRF